MRYKRNKIVAFLLLLIFGFGVIQSGIAYGIITDRQLKNSMAKNHISLENTFVDEYNSSSIFAISETYQNEFSNVTIENSLALTKTATVYLENTTVNYISLREYSKAYIYNSFVEGIYASDATNIVIVNSTVKDIQVYDFANIMLDNCTVENNLGLNDFSTSTISNSNVTELYDFHTTSVKVKNATIGLYYTTVDESDVPSNTYIVNSTISQVQADMTDPEYFDFPSVTVENSNITNYNGIAIYYGPGELLQDTLVTGTLEYMFSLDNYTINSIVNFTPAVCVFYGDWIFSNSTFSSEIDQLTFINASTSFSQTDVDTDIIMYESTMTIHDTQANFSYVEGEYSSFFINYTKITGLFSLWQSQMIAENTELGEIRSYSHSNITIANATVTEILHQTSSIDGKTALTNVTLDTLEIKYDSINLSNVNVTNVMSVNQYLHVSNFSRVNTTILSMNVYIYHDANLTDAGIQILPTDYESFITIDNVTYTSFQVKRFTIANGATFRVANVSGLDTFISVSVSTLIIENSSLTSRITTTTSEVYIQNSNLQASNPYNINFYYGNTTIVNSTIRWFSVHGDTTKIINSTVTGTPRMYDSEVTVINSTLSTESGSSFNSYNSILNFTNVFVNYNLLVYIILYQRGTNIATYLNNVTIGDSFTETIIINGTSTAVLSDTGLAGSFYNSTQFASDVVVNSKKYDFKVFDNGTLKIFNVSSTSTVIPDSIYGFDNSTIIVENTTLDTIIEGYDFSNIIFNNSHMGTYKNIWIYGNTTLQTVSGESSTFYGIYAKDYARLILSNATVAQMVRAYDYAFINLTDTIFYGPSSQYVYFMEHSEGIITSSELNMTSVFSITINTDGNSIYIKNQKLSSLSVQKNTNFTLIGCSVDTYTAETTLPTTNITELVSTRHQIIDSNIAMFQNFKRIVRTEAILNSTGLFNTSSIVYGTSLINTTVTTFNDNITITLENGTIEGTNTTVRAIYLYTGEISPIPSIYTPFEELVLEEGVAQSIYWKIKDFRPYKYSIYENDTQIVQGYYQDITTITVDLSSYAIGFYNFTILARNQYENSNTSTVLVTIIAPRPPQIIVAPLNTSFESGLSAPLSWTAIDLSPSEYRIYINGTKTVKGIWTNGTAITFTFNETNEGIFNITATFLDKLGQANSSSVFVTISSAQPPVITFLNTTTQITKYNNETVVLAWKAEDASPNQYTIYVNGTSIISDTWENNETIAYNFSGTAGTYNITIEFSDELNLTATHTVILTLLQSTGGEEETPPADYTLIIIAVIVVAVAGVVAVYLIKVKKVFSSA